MTIKEQTILIFTDAINNNNKFYELILYDNDQIDTKWGRVSSAGQSKTVYGGKAEYNRIIKSKLAKGYEHSQAVSLNISSESQSKTKLLEVAKRDILGKLNQSTELVNLIERLSKINKHQIIANSNGNIKIDDSGLVTTQLGVVMESTIDNARKLLTEITSYVSAKDFNNTKYIKTLENYLKLIPQKVPSKKGWHESFFENMDTVVKQNEFLDQLQSSINLYNTKLKEAQNLKKEPEIIEQLFSTKLEIVTDKKVIADIEKYYNESKNSNHQSSNLKLKNVYSVINENWRSNFEKVSKNITNHQLLWHGTRAFNVLSIFKMGLIVPKSGGSYHITGRMFGDGLYFSDQSSKALNYSAGYWDGGPKDDNCYMFLAEVALGNQFVPKFYNEKKYPVKGYDSTFAKANVSGVRNNEMIVYDIGQVNLKYLCEFSK